MKTITMLILAISLTGCAQSYYKSVCSEGNEIWIDSLVDGRYSPEGSDSVDGLSNADATVKRSADKVGLYYFEQNGNVNSFQTCQLNNRQFFELNAPSEKSESLHLLMTLDLNQNQEVVLGFPFTTEETLNESKVPYSVLNDEGELLIDNRGISANTFVKMFDHKIEGAYIILKKL